MSVDNSGGRCGRASRSWPERPNQRSPTRTIGLPDDPVADEARWIEAIADGIRFVSVYVLNGRTLDSPEYPCKSAFLEAMARRIGRAADAGGR